MRLTQTIISPDTQNAGYVKKSSSIIMRLTVPPKKNLTLINLIKKKEVDNMKIECCGYSMDGEITIHIYNKSGTSTYTYIVDAAFIPGWIKRMPYQPGKVLNEIKKAAIHIL